MVCWAECGGRGGVACRHGVWHVVTSSEMASAAKCDRWECTACRSTSSCLDCWVECSGRRGVPCPHGVWHIVTPSEMASAAKVDRWECTACRSSHPDTIPFPTFQGNETEWTAKLSEFFDDSALAWRRNKIVLRDDRGTAVGFRYKTKRELRLWKR